MVDFSRIAGPISRVFGSSSVAALRPTSGPDIPLIGAILERAPTMTFEGLDGMPAADTIDGETLVLNLPMTASALDQTSQIVISDVNPNGVLHRITRGPYTTADGFVRYGLTEV